MSTVLIISPEPWHAHSVSKHHYARTLAAAGHHVLFTGPPEPGFNAISLVNDTGVNHLRVVKTPRVAPGLRLLPIAVRRFLESRWLQRVEKLAGSPIDTVWLFENSRFYDMRFAGERLKIYHQVDLNQDFHPDQAAISADICLATTDFIVQRLHQVRSDVHKIHHGTAVLRERHCVLDTAPYDKPGIHVTYIGNLDNRYLDIDIIPRIVRSFPTLNFHFIGDYSERTLLRHACRSFINVHWWGKVPHTQVASLVDRSDVFLVAYKSSEYVKQLASPHKFMEYLLSGKVVVSSYTDEYKDKRHLIEMAEPDGDLEAIFSRVIADIDHYNSAEKQAERKAFALEHRYENQLARIEEIILNTTGRKI